MTIHLNNTQNLNLSKKYIEISYHISNSDGLNKPSKSIYFYKSIKNHKHEEPSLIR